MFRRYTKDELRALPIGFTLLDDRGSTWAKSDELQWNIVDWNEVEYAPSECMSDLMLKPVSARGDG
jgi:hypothetical protein